MKKGKSDRESERGGKKEKERGSETERGEGARDWGREYMIETGKRDGKVWRTERKGKREEK